MYGDKNSLIIKSRLMFGRLTFLSMASLTPRNENETSGTESDTNVKDQASTPYSLEDGILVLLFNLV